MSLTMKLLIAYNLQVFGHIKVSNYKRQKICKLAHFVQTKMSIDTKLRTHMVTVVYQYYIT